MQLVDLERTLKTELETGRLGEPVALRIHAVLPSNDNIFSWPGSFRPLLALMGDISSGYIHVQRHASHRQCAILWTTDTGKSVFLTWACPVKAKPSLHVLLLGNHGIMQLHGGETWSEVIAPKAPSLWEKEIQESLRTGTSIPVNAF
jgi:hypothetical protein